MNILEFVLIFYSVSCIRFIQADYKIHFGVFFSLWSLYVAFWLISQSRTELKTWSELRCIEIDSFNFLHISYRISNHRRNTLLNLSLKNFFDEISNETTSSLLITYQSWKKKLTRFFFEFPRNFCLRWLMKHSKLKPFSALTTGRFQFFSWISRATGKRSGNVIIYTRAQFAIWLKPTVSAQL